MPSFYDDAIDVSLLGGNSHQATLRLARYGDVWADGQYDDGSDGNVFDMDLTYQPNATGDGDPESQKVTHPYNHINGEPDFTCYGPDKELYRHVFTLENNRSADDYSGLIQFLGTFDYEGDELYSQVDQIGDIDQIARVFVGQSLLGNDDFYTRVWSHNLRLYENPVNGKFQALPWDLDRGFRIATGSEQWTSASEGQVNKLFDLPQVSRLMCGHADHLIQTSFNSTYAQAWADHYGAVRGTNYNSEVTYIQDRADYILSTLPALELYTITTNNGGDFSVDSSQVSLQGTGSYKIRELFFDGLTEPVNVKWLDDVTWQVTLNLEAGANDITTDHITPITSPPITSSPVMLAPVTTERDEQAKHCDYPTESCCSGSSRCCHPYSGGLGRGTRNLASPEDRGDRRSQQCDYHSECIRSFTDASSRPNTNHNKRHISARG